jgi:hypothetical protein
MKFPSYNLTRHPGRGREREKLAAWLAERELDLHLGGDEPPVKSGSNILRYDIQKKSAATASFRAGDIALFKPAENESRAWGPVYALLLEQGAEEGSWRAVPFSRYATPAVPGEWRTKLTADALRVLCFWNTREVEERRFLPGAVKHVPDAQRERIRGVHREVFGVREGSSVVSSRDDFGPPLLHPADPRYEYLDEERARLDEHNGESEAFAEDESEEEGPMPTGFAGIEKSEWLLAAEGRPEYGKPPD